MSETKLIYKDVSPTAKLFCNPTAEDKQPFNDLTQLNRDTGNFQGYATCEHNSRVLDGTSADFNYNGDLGYWSLTKSGADCSFTTPVKLTLTYSTPVSFVGLTITFDQNHYEYARKFSMKAYFLNELVSDETYHINKPQFFTNKQLTNVDKIEFIFYETSLPERYLKLNLIDYGITRVFTNDELMNVKVAEEVNLVSSELSVNNMNFTLVSEDPIAFLFQKKQPLELYYNGKLIGVFFIDKARQKAETTWDITTSDYIGVLTKASYNGGLFTGEMASVIIKDIMDTCHVPYLLDVDSFVDIPLYGYLPIGTAREALQQVLFACSATADTSRSSVIDMYKMPISVSGEYTQIMENSTFDQEEKVTEVRLTVHDYVKKIEPDEIAKGNATGTVEITFSGAYSDLSITGGSITLSGANYAIIEAAGDYVLSGYGYEDNMTIMSKKNPTTAANELQNIMEVSSATLVSKYNAATVLNNLYAFFIRTSIANVKIVSDELSVGDLINYSTKYLGEKRGHVISNTFNLNSSKIVADCEVLDYDS
ncbi:hypothetical protein [Dielma fastidiosa]|uniref:hypothetical protein n=1 Tax=Dielma fastidiosa TaxID=1034346 RepID=UPI000E4CEA00|nr:hypothetical protein [Dielma fastidiosa]RHN01469.1 hypothetical protein DWZ33_05610 [Dielma fastidiosa]